MNEEIEEKIQTTNRLLKYNRIDKEIPIGLKTVLGVEVALDVVLVLLERRDMDSQHREETEKRLHRLYDDEREAQKIIERLKKKTDMDRIEMTRMQNTVHNMKGALEKNERVIKEMKEEKWRGEQARQQIERTFNHELKRKDIEMNKLRENLAFALKNSGGVEERGIRVKHMEAGEGKIEEGDCKACVEKKKAIAEETTKIEFLFEENKKLREFGYESIRKVIGIYHAVARGEDELEREINEVENVNWNYPINKKIHEIEEWTEKITKRIEEEVLGTANRYMALEKETGEEIEKTRREIKQLKESITYEKKLKENNEIICGVLREEIESIKKTFFNRKKEYTLEKENVKEMEPTKKTTEEKEEVRQQIIEYKTREIPKKIIKVIDNKNKEEKSPHRKAHRKE